MVLMTCFMDFSWLKIDTLKCLLPISVYRSFQSYRWHTQNVKLMSPVKNIMWAGEMEVEETPTICTTHAL